MKNVVFKIGEVVYLHTVTKNILEPILGVILDLYSEKEDFYRYYKAILDVDPSLFKNRKHHRERYKIHSGRYRAGVGLCKIQCLVLLGDQKRMTTTFFLKKQLET